MNETKNEKPCYYLLTGKFKIRIIKSRALHFLILSTSELYYFYTCFQPSPSRSRPGSSRSRPLSRVSSTSIGPSGPLLDILERLGRLDEEHGVLKTRVDDLEVGYDKIYDKNYRKRCLLYVSMRLQCSGIMSSHKNKSYDHTLHDTQLLAPKCHGAIGHNVILSISIF